MALYDITPCISAITVASIYTCIYEVDLKALVMTANAGLGCALARSSYRALVASTTTIPYLLSGYLPVLKETHTHTPPKYCVVGTADLGPKA